MKKQSGLVILLITIFLVGCVNSNWRESTSSTAYHYSQYAKFKLQPYFDKAHVAYPPKQISLLAFKHSRRLELWAKDKKVWKYIRTYPILGESGGPGPKLHEGDRQVPEGIYNVVKMNPHSHFDLSLKLNYPDRFDVNHAKKDGRHKLGNNIFIHGSHYSVGCLAVGNAAIRQLFVLTYLVGTENVQVIIAPDDLRVKKPIYGKVRPSWLSQLYIKIKRALKPFINPHRTRVHFAQKKSSSA